MTTSRSARSSRRFARFLCRAVIPWVVVVPLSATPVPLGTSTLDTAGIAVATSSPTPLSVHSSTGSNGAASLRRSPAVAHDTASATTATSVGVGVERCTFIDSSRSVLTYATTPASVRSRHRTLLTEIRYPTLARHGGTGESTDAAPLARHGGYPVVVFAHGYDVSPDTYAALLDQWARDGFVVVAPFFPDEKSSAVTAQHGVNTEGDLANEPADLSFVLRQVLASSRTARPGCPVVRGLANPTQVALSGQSDGANAVATLVYSQGRDPQGVPYRDLVAGLGIKATVILSGQEIPGQTYRAPRDAAPLLMVQSLHDQCNSLRSAVTLYRDVRQGAKWFLELQTAHHLPPYDGIDQPAFRIVVGVTVHFFMTALEKATFSTSLLEYANRDPSVARMFHNQTGPPLTDVPDFTGVCGLT